MTAIAHALVNPNLGKAVLRTKEAHKYVGGKPIWDELVKNYPDQLVPFRKARRGDTSWLVSVIDRVLILAQAEGTLLNPSDDDEGEEE